MSTSNFKNQSGAYGFPQFPFAAEFSQMYSSTSPSSGSSGSGFASRKQASTPQVTPENHWTSQNRVVYGSPAIPYISELSGWDGSTSSPSGTSSSGLATPPQGPTAHLAPLVAHTTAEQHETQYSPEVIEECERLARFIADGGALKQVDPIVYEDSQVFEEYRHLRHVDSSMTGLATYNVAPRFDVAQTLASTTAPYPPGAPRYSYRNDNVANAYHGNSYHSSFPSTESGDVQHVALSRTGSTPYNLDVVPHLEFAHEKRTMGMPLAAPICAPRPPPVAYYSDPSSNGASTYRGPQQARSFGSISPISSQTIAEERSITGPVRSTHSNESGLTRQNFKLNLPAAAGKRKYSDNDEDVCENNHSQSTIDQRRKRTKKEPSTQARRDAAKPEKKSKRPPPKTTNAIGSTPIPAVVDSEGSGPSTRRPPKRRVGNPYPPPTGNSSEQSIRPELAPTQNSECLAPKTTNAIGNTSMPPVIASAGPSTIWPANGTSTAPKLRGPSQSTRFPNQEDDSNSWAAIRHLPLGEDGKLVRVLPSAHRPREVKKRQREWSTTYYKGEIAISEENNGLRVPPQAVGVGWRINNGRMFEQRIRRAV